MPAQVTVTRTVTSTTASVITVNTGYTRTATGLLKVFETILGAICIGLISYYCSHYNQYNRISGFAGGREEAFFFLVSFAFLITTFLLLLACLISITSATLLPKSTFESLYHFVAFIFYVSASVALLVEISQRNNRYHHYKEYGYEGKMAAAAIGLVNSLLYVLSFILSIRTFRIA